MLLRGKASEDQLQFNPEIEKSAKSNRKKAKAKKKQGVQLESQPRTKSTANRDHPPPKKHKTEPVVKPHHPTNRTKFTSVEREERYTLFSNGLYP
ncbi:hypothetical protein Lal_00029624 [Lupinus albus]|nr:hypothetical protein Lal_00029624 [Lupinus albus]